MPSDFEEAKSPHSSQNEILALGVNCEDSGQTGFNVEAVQMRDHSEDDFIDLDCEPSNQKISIRKSNLLTLS